MLFGYIDELLYDTQFVYLSIEINQNTPIRLERLILLCINLCLFLHNEKVINDT